MARVDTFNFMGKAWSACEDLQQPGGALALVSKGETQWFTKSHELFGSAKDESYYLNLTKAAVKSAKTDILAVTLLSANYTYLTWELVANAIPPIRHSGGVRAFVGSRGSSVDTTFSDTGEDAAGYGFPQAASYVFNLTNLADGGTPIGDARKYVNYTAMAEGLVGGGDDTSPAVVFYYPVLGNSPYLPNSTNGRRYWTMVAVGQADMHGSREQSVQMRFQQVSTRRLQPTLRHQPTLRLQPTLRCCAHWSCVHTLVWRRSSASPCARS